MIDVDQVLQTMPHFTSFCSVDKLRALVESLQTESTHFKIEVAGTSRNGFPIHHLQFGSGSVKALVVGFPHCDEPIGGLTVFSLLTLLNQGNSALVDSDVEWHIVPCIDPDGAMLNEGWSQKAFTLESFMRNFHKQVDCEQVECSFPIKYKNLVFNQPVIETTVLQEIISKIRPDFYYPLHNAWAGGAFFFLTRDIGEKYYQKFYQLLNQHGIPLQVSAPHRAWCAQFGEGIYEMSTMRKFYDFLERTCPAPEEVLHVGACSWEYLTEIKQSAISFVAELPYVRHPSDGSRRATGQNQRQLKLRIDADNKFVATVILEEWDHVKEDLDLDSAFYKKVANGLVSTKDMLHEGLPWSPYKTRDLLFNPAYGGPMTEGELFNVFLFDRFYVLCHSYEFVRLLKASTQTAAVKRATDRLEALFGTALEDIAKSIAFGEFEVVDCDTLAKVQLGSGLTVLNSILETRGNAS